MPQNFKNVFNAAAVPPDQQARQVIFEKTGSAPESVVLDGNLRRFRTSGDKGSEKSGWYVLFGSGVPAGAFGNWRTGESFRWRAIRTEPLSAGESALLEEHYRLARAKRDASILQRQERAARTCREIWNQAPEALDSHPYLQKKKVRNHGLRSTGDGRLIMPVFIGQEITSLQYIGADGKKEFHYGGRAAGGFFRIPAWKPAADICFVAEGYATAASVHEATGCEVWVGLNAGNLFRVGQTLREARPGADIVFVGDNDLSGTGQRAAEAAAEAAGGRVIIPPVTGDANDYALAGNNLRELLLKGQRRHWIFPFSHFCLQPQPVRWLIRGWLQAEGMHMVFGPSGAGKSFAVVDMAASVACPEVRDWHGMKLKHGPVVYLTGEGYTGLKQRFVGWSARRGVKDLPVYLSEESRDLNTPEGLRDVINEIRSYKTEPCLIIADTLNRFMAGDENKAQDTKTMLDACTALQREFRCAVCLIHHSGVSETAQNRARGSSAWRGAMDVEIQVRGDGDSCLTLNQTKNKDAERQKPLNFEMVLAEVPGWFDEDGFQITTRVLRRTAASEVREESLTRAQNFALRTFEKAAGTLGLLDGDGNFAGVERKAWREVFFSLSSASTQGARRTAFYKGIRDLLALGVIREENDIFRPAGFMSRLKERCYTLQLNGEGESASYE
ncbi:MAG: AAA family ATPase [Fretibacterium sp.]|nr:AAA family ATPase [Fretibacterium sp.]